MHINTSLLPALLSSSIHQGLALFKTKTGRSNVSEITEPKDYVSGCSLFLLSHTSVIKIIERRLYAKIRVNDFLAHK